jgi:inosine-uridine nucleoside N-ribohydrolase
MTRFAAHDDDWYRDRLRTPQGRPRIVIDTDAANEIDDQFALAWTLLSPQQLELEAVYAAPFSFEHRRQEMIRAQQALAAPGAASCDDLALASHYRGRLDHAARMGWDLHRLDLAPFNPPARGMERSFEEILTVFDKLGIGAAGRVFKGSAGYLPSPGEPVRSEAAEHLVATALATPPDAEPLYVLALGCVTNIASALLMAPEIAERIVVVWTSGFPSHAPQVNHSFNLEQDMAASTLLLDSGVPHVYLPGYHVGAQLRLSLPEMERHVKGRGAIGDYLHELFIHNPLHEMLGITDLFAHSWVIWDVINIAWMLQPDWVPSELVRTPRLLPDRRWQAAPGRHLMREAHAVQRDAIFRDFFLKLARGGAQ